MKSTALNLILATITAGAVAMADDNSTKKTKGLPGSEQTRSLSRDELKMSLSVKDYLGVDLVDSQGASLGRIVDFTLKGKDRSFDAAIVSTSGPLGFNEVLVAVPFSDIQQNPGTRDLVLNVSKADFDALVTSTREEKKSESDSRNAANKRSTATAAKTPKDPDVKKAMAALEAESVPAINTKAVVLQKNEDKIIVSGTVESERQRDRIIEVVRNNTRCEVVDEMRVN